MAYNEAKFQTEFNKWLSRQNWPGTFVCELKVCKTKSMPFNAVKPHQVRNLQLAKQRLIYKIPDAGYDQKPFDCFQISNAEAFVVVLFYQPRKPKEFIMIEVEHFVDEVMKSKRASLTKERACAIGTVYEI
jgi:hypothetical protein